MTDKRDKYGVLLDPAEAMQEFLLGLHDLMDEAELAQFPPDLIARLNEVRLRFVDEFEARHPGRGRGRAIWR